MLSFLFLFLLLAVTPVHASAAPDIFFVLADDLDVESMDQLERIQTMLGDHGARFQNAFVSLSLCCASRSTMLRGQYAHNTGVYKNEGPDGGFPAFHGLGREADTLAVWLQRAGYRTALFGKYLNNYPDASDKRYIPPGWSQWFAANGGDIYGQYRYRMNQNGWTVRYGSRPSDYMVDVIRGQVRRFVEKSKDQPLFAWVAPVSPHSPATAAPRYAGSFSDLTAPRPPNFNETDMSDKPSNSRPYKPISAAGIDQIDRLYRERLGAH